MSPADRSSPSPVWCYSVFAAAEACVMPRVLEQFAKRGVVPLRFSAVATGANAQGLDIDVQVADLPAETVDHIAECLRQMIHVERVLMAVKSPAEPCLGATELSR